ncbi:hypothetical protein [Agromyces allii]|uniref:Uncharacterized protein n=1 Tax=Agromyces allii TaxID=393607 RepID=A0ABP5BE70_9MICO|nr:hypothetical protein [Agromyces allii]
MDEEVIAYFIARQAAVDPCAVSRYSVYLNNLKVQVTIHDYGESAGATRFMAEARYVEQPDEREIEMNTWGLSLGNADSTVRGALDNVHWNVFRPLD